MNMGIVHKKHIINAYSAMLIMKKDKFIQPLIAFYTAKNASYYI